jgi:hypothetical protein
VEEQKKEEKAIKLQKKRQQRVCFETIGKD